MELAEVIEKVSTEGDYSHRVHRHGDDEIGLLYHGFNNMLGQIQARKEERDKVENALRKSEARLQAILDHSPALISIKDLQGNIILVNRNFDILEGPSLEEYIGKNVYDLFPADVADALWKNDLAALEAGHPIEVEEVIAHKDGLMHTYLTVKFPLYGGDQKAFGICAISTDITERKRVEEELREAKEYLDKIFLNLPVGVAILDGLEFRYFRISKTLADINGLPVEDHLGKPLAEVLPDAARDILPRMRKVLETGEAFPNHEFSATKTQKNHILKD